MVSLLLACAFLFSPYLLHALPWLDYSNCIWRTVQVMKPLIISFSPTSCYFFPLRSKYSPQLSDPSIVVKTSTGGWWGGGGHKQKKLCLRRNGSLHVFSSQSVSLALWSSLALFFLTFCQCSHMDGERNKINKTQDQQYYRLGVELFMLVSSLAYSSEGDTFLRNVCWLSTDYTALYPRMQDSS
jgi:hypothetical protein